MEWVLELSPSSGHDRCSCSCSFCSALQQAAGISSSIFSIIVGSALLTLHIFAVTRCKHCRVCLFPSFELYLANTFLFLSFAPNLEAACRGLNSDLILGERQVQFRRRRLALILLKICILLEPSDYTPCKLSFAISSKSRSQCNLQAKSKPRKGLLCDFVRQVNFEVHPMSMNSNRDEQIGLLDLFAFS